MFSPSRDVAEVRRSKLQYLLANQLITANVFVTAGLSSRKSYHALTKVASAPRGIPIARCLDSFVAAGRRRAFGSSDEPIARQPSGLWRPRMGPAEALVPDQPQTEAESLRCRGHRALRNIMWRF